MHTKHYAWLFKNPNPFAAVMEAAWQFLKKPRDEQSLARLKLDIIQRLLKRNLPKNQAKAIISFITLYVGFENSAIRNQTHNHFLNLADAKLFAFSPSQQLYTHIELDITKAPAKNQNYY